MRENDSQAIGRAIRSNSRITDDPQAKLSYAAAAGEGDEMKRPTKHDWGKDWNAIFAAAGLVGCFFGLLGFISMNGIVADLGSYSRRMPATMQCVAPGRAIAVDELQYDAVEIRESVAYVRWFFAAPLTVIGLGALGWIGSKRPW